MQFTPNKMHLTPCKMQFEHAHQMHRENVYDSTMIQCTSLCIFLGKELCESRYLHWMLPEEGFMQVIGHKYTPLTRQWIWIFRYFQPIQIPCKLLPSFTRCEISASSSRTSGALLFAIRGRKEREMEGETKKADVFCHSFLPPSLPPEWPPRGQKERKCKSGLRPPMDHSWPE